MTGVADLIRNRSDDIMRRWVVEARSAASARGLSKPALANVMPSYLVRLADELGHAPRSRGPAHRYLQDHASARLRQGYDVAEVVTEVVMLERCISQTWAELPESARPRADDIDRLHEHLLQAIIVVTDTFREHLLEDEQTEKRYLRLLQLVATEALNDDDRPLRGRLRELLEIVQEAMGAACAAFVFFDRANGDLILTACAGHPELEPYAASLAPRSFVAEVAATEGPIMLQDATATELEIPEALKRSGIRALLGVRLPEHHELFGVMYVGVTEARDFTARERRRLAALGERLALVLLSARLFAALRERIAALEVERALRERFVSALAHDLRGPLNAAALAAGLLEKAMPHDGRRDLPTTIMRNVERIERMIGDLLDANRIRAGEPLPLRLDVCDLGVLVRQLAEDARETHGDRFVVVGPSSLRGIWSETDLHRALWNLITNAVKYGDAAAPITIALSRRDQRVAVSVTNRGHPIAADDHERIFDAYARSPAAVAGGRVGWGLGLTLVRGTAEAHGGHVSVTSDAHGTTFTIELPLDATHVDAATGPHGPAASPRVH